MLNSFESAVYYKESIDFNFADPEKDLLIVDKAVVSFLNPVLHHWKYIYPVEGGEALKDWKAATEHIQALCELWGMNAHRNSRVLVCGGGSVGDFGGFFASIIKRGVRCIQIPTTWLSAIDSAHGGKTALNVSGIKNQLGTFYPAQEVHIFREILSHQSPDHSIDGFGECLKMLMFEQEASLSAIFAEPLKDLNDFLWTHLKKAVDKKYEIVLADPYELKGPRKLLNLGHTFGHALETATKRSHGLCVLQGLVFSLRWSVQKKYSSPQFLENVLRLIRANGIVIWDELVERHFFSEAELRQFLTADKKSLGRNELDFVFVKNAGNVFSEKVHLDEFILEARRQGWIL